MFDRYVVFWSVGVGVCVPGDVGDDVVGDDVPVLWVPLWAAEEAPHEDRKS